jgi:hypothetical protein
MWGTPKATFCWLARTLAQCGREAIASAHAIAAGTTIILAIASLAVVARGAPTLAIAAGCASTFAVSPGTAPTFAIAAGTTIILTIPARAALLIFAALTRAAISPLLPTRVIS